MAAGRRALLGSTLGLAAGALTAAGAAKPAAAQDAASAPAFQGVHQNGIALPQQAHTCFVAFDMVATHAADLADLMRRWTDAAARLTQGLPAGPEDTSPDEAQGLPAARLTLTFGLGQSLFGADGADRFGLARHRPAAFVDLPRFTGDQLVAEHTGGDLCVQACADDPQAALYAIRQLVRLAYGVAELRWGQNGFLPRTDGRQTPRNLMGFKDGSNNIGTDDAAALDRFVWAGEEAPGWMRGGSYMVARKIRIALQHWDRMKLAFQEQTVGRRKQSGAPLGAAAEFAPADLAAADADGNPVIPENAHMRLASAQANDGARLLRRSYSYDNGISMVTERWPPWRHGMQIDAGLLFICYQRDPRTGFIPINERLAKFDMMNQFVTAIGGGLFACPKGAAPGRYIAQDLIEAGSTG